LSDDERPRSEIRRWRKGVIEDDRLLLRERSLMSPEAVRGEIYVLPLPQMPISTGGTSHALPAPDDIQYRMDATRRVLVACDDPPDPDQSGFAGTLSMVQVCKQHDPDPRRSMPMPRPPGSVPIGERPRR
jgi:hypothetical protein